MAITAAVLTAGQALAAWPHWSIQPGAVYTNTIGLQLYDALAERYAAAEQSMPTITAQFKSLIGYTNQFGQIWTNALGTVYTNVLTFSNYGTTNLTDRNCFLEYVLNGYTNQPHLTVGILTNLDLCARSLSAYYAQHWATNAVGGYTRTDGLPNANPAAIMEHLDIGYRTNLTRDAYGFITAGDAYFTRVPPVTQNWELAEARLLAGGWTYANSSTFDLRYYAATGCVLRYFPNVSTNTLSAMSITIQGTIIVQSNQTTAAGQETVTVSGTDTELSNRWYAVTNIIATNTAAAYANDAIAVMYPGTITLHGDWPWTLYAEDMNERIEFIDAMRATILEPDPTESVTIGKALDNGEYYGASCASALADAATDWAAVAVLTNANVGYGVGLYFGLSPYDNSYYIFEAIHAKARAYSTDIPVSTSCTVQVFYWITNPTWDIESTITIDTNKDFSDIDGLGLIENAWHPHETYTNHYATTNRGGAAEATWFGGDVTVNPFTAASVACPVSANALSYYVDAYSGYWVSFGASANSVVDINDKQMQWLLWWDFKHKND